MRCAICEGGDKGDQGLYLCSKCADPTVVMTFCAECHHRDRFEAGDAHALLALNTMHFPIKHIVAGVTICFENGCPRCKPDEWHGIRVFKITNVAA